ncbi:hypothetical protein LTS12_023594 [Elasticomyces elasticus]|nr:hypothetical protein LTS12_023594 [Elasticomyces elasticus]
MEEPQQILVIAGQLLPYLENKEPPAIWYVDLMPKVSSQYFSQPFVQAYDFLIMEDKTPAPHWVNIEEARQLSRPFTTIPLSIQSNTPNVVREKRVLHRQGFSVNIGKRERTYVITLNFGSRDFANSFKDRQRAETDFEGCKFVGFAWEEELFRPIRSLESQGQITLRHFSVDLESAAPDTPASLDSVDLAYVKISEQAPNSRLIISSAFIIIHTSSQLIPLGQKSIVLPYTPPR